MRDGCALTDGRAWIDITVPLRPGMPQYPGDEPFRLRRTDQFAEHGYRISSLSLSAHAGTHVDAPAHFLAAGADLDALPVDFFSGPARVVPCPGSVIGAREIAAAAPRPGEFILLRTHDGSFWRSGHNPLDYAALDRSGAEALIKTGARGVGIDTLSVGRPGQEALVHRALFQAGMAIVEGLDLSAAEPGPYELLCLPLRVAGCEGAPARAILRRIPPFARTDDSGREEPGF